MSNHPMCNDCVAKSVCAAKYGQSACVEVHGKLMEYGALVANSDFKEDSKNSPSSTEQQTQSKISQLLRDYEEEIGVHKDNKLFYRCIVEYVEKHSDGA